MHGASKLRTLGGLVLAALIGLITCELVEAAPKKAPARVDPTKKAQATGLLPDGAKLSATDLARHIDAVIGQKLKSEKVDGSPRSSDEEFLRRVYLDITGKIPTHDQAVAFLDSKESNKRARLIDDLLSSKDYGRHMADIWQALLLPRNSDNRRIMQWYPNLVKWMEEQFNANVGWDRMTRDILTATGPVDKPSPVVYWVANATADKVTDNVSRMFLGVQLQCAQCHNHPFTDWKQDEYWGMAAFFLKVRPDGNPKGAAKKKGTVKIVEKSGVVNRKRLPESAKMVAPKFFRGEQPAVAGKEAVRPILAEWMTTAKNPFFARAMVNRVWAQFYGRGIVNPIDDMHEGNVPSHPELLADLSKQFAASGFDLKYLVRAICNSESYQRTSRPAGNNVEAAPELIARMAVKVVTPEQLYDSLTLLVGEARKGTPRRKGGNRYAPNAREGFVTFFSAEDGADPTEYQSGIPQVLRLMNAPQLNNASIISSIQKDAKTSEQAVERLYLTVLSRRPTAEEKTRVNAYIRKNGEGRDTLAGVLWALMNSSEFALNR